MSAPDASAAEHTAPSAVSSELLVTTSRRHNLWDWLALVFVVLLPFLFYWRAALGLGMFFFGDIARFFFPTKVLYAQALSAGRLPLWQPEILTGVPLLAEMQTGALYPLHLLLYRFLPVDLALNYDILLHLALLGAGIFLFARVKHISTIGAVLAALALTLGGFGAARITHPNVLSVASWLPWLLYFHEQWRLGFHRALMWAFLTIAFALQWLGGHPQFALINCLTFTAFVFGSLWIHRQPPPDNGLRPLAVRRPPSPVALQSPDSNSHSLLTPLSALLSPLSALVPPFSSLALGALIAAMQLLPTFEFARQSARAGGVDQDFFTTFSFHPLYLALLGAPFLRGNPYPNTSVEVIAYVGVLPLILAFVALILKRERETWFWALLGLGALLLAFGGNTPLYPALRGLPFFNLFRVPARFLFPFEVSLALLAGFGFDALRARTFESKLWRNALLAGGAALVLSLVILIGVNFLTVDTWLDLWRGLPVLFGALALLLVLRASRTSRSFFTISAVGLTLVDVLAFSAVYAQTYNQIAPRAEIFPRPRVLDQLNLETGARIMTSEWILPWISVMDQSLFSNLNAAHGVTAAHGYTPLTPRNTREFLDNLTPVMLNKLGVRYYLIPQLLPVDPKTEGADVHDPFLIDPVTAPLEFSIVDADSIEIESSLAQSASLPNNAPVANVILTDQDGKEYRVQLLAGRDTAEWAYDRSDVLRVIKYPRPEVASTFPARSAFPIENHVGHTFRTRLNFAPSPAEIVKLRVEPLIDPGLLHIQNITLLNGDAQIDLAPLLGKGRHVIIYRSEDVAVYENLDAAPRAFVTHNVKQADDAEAFRQLQAPIPNAQIFVSDGPEFDSDLGQGLDEHADISLYEPERVILDTHLDSDGYVVLTDAWDPGWIALVDGVPAPITRADVIFRAVQLPEGSHRVEFLYRPRSFYIGLLLSGIGIAILAIALLVTVLVRAGRPRLNSGVQPNATLAQ